MKRIWHSFLDWCDHRSEQKFDFRYNKITKTFHTIILENLEAWDIEYLTGCKAAQIKP